jgi:hypothetical protein
MYLKSLQNKYFFLITPLFNKSIDANIVMIHVELVELYCFKLRRRRVEYLEKIVPFNFSVMHLSLHSVCSHMHERIFMKYGSIVAHPMPFPSMYNLIH